MERRSSAPLPVAFLVALLVATLLPVTLLPTTVARAAVPAPVLTSPVGVTVPDTVVDFDWQRVPGATGYVVRVYRATAGLHEVPLIEQMTVNDRFFGVVALYGAEAKWTVTSISDSGGSTSLPASFTTAREPWVVRAPAEDTVITHPDETVTFDWEVIPETPANLTVEPDPTAASPATPLHQNGRLTPGAWRWRLEGLASPWGFLPDPPDSPWRQLRFEWPGSTPTMTSPANGAAFEAGSSIRLRVQPVVGASHYGWEVFHRESERWVQVRIFAAEWSDLPDLLEAGTYEWRVRAIQAGTMPDAEFGPWSATRTFTVAATRAPVVTAPADAAALDHWPILRWDPIPDAEGYILQVGTAPGVNVVTPVPVPKVNAFAFAAPSAEPTAAQSTAQAATRAWRVRVALPGTDESPWSPWRTFSVAASDGQPAAETAAVMTGPDDCGVDACVGLPGAPILRWDPVPGARSYRVFVRWDDDPGPADIIVDVGGPSWPLDGFDPEAAGDRIAWAVLACPAAGCSETMPATRSHFRIGLPPPIPTGPADGTVQAASSFGFSWAAPALPTDPDVLPVVGSYDFEYEITPGEFAPEPGLYRFVRVRHTIQTVLDIRTGTSIRWRVRLRSGFLANDPSVGEWSGWQTAQRVVPPIALTAPANEAVVSTTTPRLDWEPAPFGATMYRVEVARANLLDQYHQDWWGWAAHVGSTSVDLPAMPPGRYRWRVQLAGTNDLAVGDDGWTEGWFTIPGTPTITLWGPAPDEQVPADDVLMRWAPFPSAPYYSIQIGTTTDLSLEANIVYGGYSHTNQHAVTERLPAGPLYWRVCAPDQCSPVRRLIVGPPLSDDVAPPTLGAVSLRPTPSGSLGRTDAVSVTASWSATDSGTGIWRQDVQVRAGSGAWRSVAVATASRSVPVLIDPLAGSSIEVRVRVYDRANNGSPWRTAKIASELRQESSTGWTWAGAWTSERSSGASRLARRWSTTAGATASMTFTGRGVVLFAPTSAGRGTAEITIDGIAAGTVDLATFPSGDRRVIFTRSWPTSGTHTIRVKVLGTPGRPRVEIDAIAILR